MVDDSGIKQTGKSKWSVRVKRVEKRTGLQVNRKATVLGSKADARRARDELRAELGSTTLKRPRTRFRDFAESWLARRGADPEVKPSLIRKYTFDLARILPVLGDLYIDAITPADITDYVSSRVAVAGVKGGNTILNELRLLRTMAKDSVAEGYAERDWCFRVKPPKVRMYTRERPNLLTASQFAAVLGHISSYWRGLVLLIATTGLRWGEASALHWEDVNLEAGEAVIRWGNYRGERITVKNRGSNRVVPVLPEVAAAWGLRRARGLVFPTKRNALHRGTPLRKVLADACLKAEVPRITTHGLRRTFNNLARQSTSLAVLKSITGHSTDAMVEHYSLVGTDEKTVVSRSIADSFGVLPVSDTPSDDDDK